MQVEKLEKLASALWNLSFNLDSARVSFPKVP